LSAGRILGLDETVRIIGQTCDALNCAHRHRIYHRDIKPENIMFSRAAGVKLGDFGIARIASRRTITQQGVFIGTAPYMSFEQARGWQDIDGRSDLYSLGIVLYEMVTGQLPFTGEPLFIIEQHLRHYPPPPSQLNPSLPSWMDDVVMRALDKDRNRRFQTAEEMARALGYQEPMHEDNEPVTQPPQPVAPPRGQPRLVVFVGGQPSGQIPLARQAVELGRETGVFAYEDSTMSRRHARVYWNSYNWVIEDLNSSNGTFLNGQRIWQPEVLLPEATITLGDTQLRFEV
jgi:serine/threonine protein kinase